MQKRVDTECKTADQSRHQEQGSAAAQTRCRAGEQLMEMLHASSPASTPTGVPHQGGEYHSKVPAAEEAEQAAADVAAEVATVALPPRAFQPRVAARAGTSASSRLLRGAGLGGWDGLSSLEHLSQLESLAHAMLNGMGMGGAGLGASNLAALSATLSARGLSPQLSPQLSAQLSAGFDGAGFRGGLLGRGLSGGNGRRRPRVARQWLPRR